MAYASDGDTRGERGWRPAAEGGLAAAIATATVRLQQVSAATRRSLETFPEIDCVRHRLAPGVVAAAERRAAALGVGADEVLIAAGEISEDRYSRLLAFALGLRFAELDSLPRQSCPLSEERMLQAPKAGMLPLLSDDELIWVIAPSGRNVRHVISFIGAHPELRWQVVITSPAHLRRFVRRHADHALGEQAADWLRDRYPVCSAAASMPRRWILSAAIAAAAIFGLVMAPAASLIALQVAVSVVFLAWTGLRVMGMLLPPAAAAKPLRLDEAALPVYTIIVALYREATAVPGLIESLRALEYPLEKLDVKLVLEADDPQTRLAVAAMELRPPFEVMFAPDVGPRTKPKALNAALAFARGEFTVIFDAEDRPQPGQLREALTAFQADRTGELACVQARLAIDNTSDSWLAALFAAEYAGQFDVLLPGLASLNLPLPLGGSSNHFRTSILRQAGAWDAYNVTEDADLGTRLARLGYRTGVIASTTQEEAPTHFEPWLKQRTRWLKGWMQTWQVHMRQPWRLVRDLGIAGFTTFQLMLIGTVLAALLQPIVVGFIIAGSLIELAAIVPAGVNDWPILGALHWSALAAGYLASVALALAGLVRRRLRWIIWLLPLMLVHWAFLSIAAWRALHQLCRDPYRWEKTEHRLGRRPRRS